ncbi:lipoate--protein ligase [Anaerovorax odorimutans]|uniref:Lipoate--protein ligase n=1 Tax=Anaerovorax odorimutans TaxID=109327 RepID=A0ABT1RSW2_9FIRM|nr:lipoate--protein ligase [Anaerovorax odorimutans]MCQ4638273.1 lipoate--protein ligase [Anaerovorax odorimutans]
MKYLKMPESDVYYNLALEEYLFDHYKDEDLLLLWKNHDSIVVGKYQNVYQEVNIKQVEESGIPVARRNTGGGTVFHDKGNLNYSFITDHDPKTFSDYEPFVEPVIRALGSLGVSAEKRNKSDIAIQGKKISGNAQTIKGGRILHHGTLLFDADLESLGDALRPGSGVFSSKAVESIRSQVTNIKDYLREATIDQLETCLLKAYFGDEKPQPLALSDAELEEVSLLREAKYITWEWNYGRSPEFSFQKTGWAGGSKVAVELHVKKGLIAACGICCDEDLEQKIDSQCAQRLLVGIPYSYTAVYEFFSQTMRRDLAAALTDCFF